jgi:hypothetical protein
MNVIRCLTLNLTLGLRLAAHNPDKVLFMRFRFFRVFEL